MSDQHIIVTGAGGYIGRHVVTALLDRGHRVTAVLRPGSVAQVDGRAALVRADVLKDDFDVESLSADIPDALIHLAWQDGFDHRAESHMRLLSAHFSFLLNTAAWGVERLSVLGTMHEVGYWQGAIVADTPTNPTALYGIAKDALRRSLFAALGGAVTIQWLRCYYVFGDDRNNRSIFTKLLEAEDEGKATFPFNSGKNLYDFIDVVELGDQIASISSQDALCGVINCSTGRPVSLGAQVESFIASHGLKIRLEYGAFPDREYDSPGVWGDASQINALLAGQASS